MQAGACMADASRGGHPAAVAKAISSWGGEHGKIPTPTMTWWSTLAIMRIINAVLHTFVACISTKLSVIIQSGWGFQAMVADESALISPTGQPTSLLLQPARWFGHRRWATRRRETKDRADAIVELSCRRGVRLYPQPPTTHGLSFGVIPRDRQGMNAELQRDLNRQVAINGGFPRGRRYTWYRDRASDWGGLHWEIARTLRRGAGTFYIEYEGQAVDLTEELPSADGPLQVALRTGEYPTTREEPRQRSRSPRPRDASRSRSSRRAVRWWNRIPSTPRGVTDEDQVLCILKTAHGWLELPLFKQDFSIEDWSDVPLAMAASRLHKFYAELLPFPSKVTFVDCGYRAWRPGDSVADAAANGQCWVVPRDDQYGAGKAKKKAKLVENVADQSKQYVTVQLLSGNRWVPYRFRKGREQKLSHKVLWKELMKQRSKLGLEELQCYFLNTDERLVSSNEAVHEPDDATPLYFAIPSPKYGAEEPTPKQQASQIRKAIQGGIHGNQLRLLLKGDQGFASRAQRLMGDPKKLKQLVVDTAARYKMQTVPTKVDEVSAQYDKKQAKTQPMKSPQGRTVKPKVEQTYEPPQLDPAHWSVPPMPLFKPGKEGVFMAPTQEAAEQAAKQLKSAVGAIAILSVRPLPEARSTSKVTFLMSRPRRGDNPVKSVVHGYLGQFGTVPVAHTQPIAHITPTKGEPSTVVLSILATKSTIKPEEWTMIRKCTDVSSVKKALTATVPNPLYEDVFRLQTGEQKVSFLVRVRKSVLALWLSDEKLPCTCAPLGEYMQSYRILWDRQETLLQAMRDKYRDLPGFAGIVQTTKGMGARIQASRFGDAQLTVGQDAGENYLVKGIPVEMPVAHLETLLADMKWEATVQADSRRTRGRTATVRVRAKRAPSTTLFQVLAGEQSFAVHVEKIEPKPRREKEQPSEPPSSWAEAAKRAMGRREREQASDEEVHTPILPVRPDQMDTEEQNPQAGSV